MSCEEYLANRSRRLAAMTVNASLTSEVNATDVADIVSFIFTDIALPTICALRPGGNLLNLAVLTRKQLQRSMDTMEKSAHIGLVALAVSDLLFCLCAFPVAFLRESKYLYTEEESLLPFYYDTYVKTPVLNIFIICSTWLTVVMASARYLAICLPLHARAFIKLSGTRIAILSVFTFSILLNLPRFWYYHIASFQCAEQCTCYVPRAGVIWMHTNWIYAYELIFAILGVFIPLIVLAFCNFCLIRALRQSSRMQRKYRVSKPKDSGHRITPTLITIVILFFILVVPSELMKFFEFILSVSTHTSKAAWHIMNFIQACNFAINFVLYCALNVHFRKTVQYLFCCKWHDTKYKIGKPQPTTNNHTMTLMTDMETDI